MLHVRRKHTIVAKMTMISNPNVRSTVIGKIEIKTCIKLNHLKGFYITLSPRRKSPSLFLRKRK